MISGDSMCKERRKEPIVGVLLRHHRLLDGAPEELVEQSSYFFVERNHRKGTVLFEQGDVITGLYLITAGKVRISRVTTDGGGFTLAILGDQDVIGEEAISDKEKTATTRALSISDTTLLCIAKRDLMTLINRFPLLAVNLAKYVQRKREDTIAALEDLSVRKASERIVRLLNRLGRQHGRDDPRGLRIDLRLTHEQIALLIGATRETVSLEILRLVRDGTILSEGGYFIVPPASVLPFTELFCAA